MLLCLGMLAAVTGTGCEADRGAFGSSDADSDGDTDGDTDTDADSDGDGDGDTDTEYTGPVIPPTCEDAVDAKTSVGCEFYTADVDNWDSADPATYAIVVSNPHEDQNADVVLEHGNSGEIYGVVLTPGELHVINVTCDSGCLLTPQQIEIQGISTGAGFRLSADVPILAYQWNPYGTELFSTDASLLIPTTSLDGTYIAAAWDTGPGASWPQLTSQITVVITEDNTEISFTSSVNVPEMGGVGPFTAGVESGSYTLGEYDVISLSPSVLDADLTGTVVQANKPVVVFGGHSCANVPSGAYAACDHVEEQILPLAAWGTATVLAKHADRQGCTNQLVVWRIIAGADDMTVTFDPPAPAPFNSSYVMAQQGELISFESDQDHYVEGVLNDPPDPDEPAASFFAYQMMTGCTYGSCTNSEGDPMMLQSPPAGQFLDRYVFNTDAVFDFDYDHIVIVRQEGTEVDLDCLGVIPDSEFTPVGTTDWQTARIFIDNPENSTGCLDGAHVLTATDQVGLSVAGSSSANSYGYLGGVGVRAINPAPIIE
jgi:hypothetical protein